MIIIVKMIFSNILIIFTSYHSFDDVPKITQDPFSLEVKLSWTDNILHLAKCVDYFYVEHAQIANGYVIIY